MQGRWSPGTKGLRKFVDEHFSGWGAVNLNDLESLVVDGDSICAQFYHNQRAQAGCWLLGGEYTQFYKAIREFFAEILFTGVQVLVIFSGIKKEWPRAETIYVRRTRFYEAVRRAQGRMGWGSKEGVKVTPLLVKLVCMDALRSLGIQLRVTNSEARKEVAAFANHRKCPVLAADADFFAFELESGYLPLHKLRTVIASGLAYHVKEFRSQFNLKEPDLLLLAIVSEHSEATRENCDFKMALGRISAHETSEDYLAKEGSEEDRKNFELLKDYFRDLHLPSDHDDELFGNLPEWVIRSFRLGCFEPQLLNVHLRNTYVLHTFAEDIHGDSAWLVSRHIRQHLYGFIGLPDASKVKEVIRAKSSPEVIDAYVSPCNFSPPLSFRDFADKDINKTHESVVLDVLKYRKLSQDDLRSEFDTLEDKWKLPIAAAFYWYQTCEDPPVPRHLVKSLLLSFLVCSGEIQTSRIPPLEPVTRSTKPDVLMALHAFAQWQCVYYDARALNYLAREPFPTTSPACLYSGEVAMHYASFARRNLSVDSALVAHSREWVLYKKFLYLVTGSDGKGKVGGHAKHPSKPKAPLPTLRETPSLKETNRFALLLDSEHHGIA